ncbi:hypothetical protein [Paraferrimonas sedimenticola]|uniref:PilZ domain-containing protein n=1 Tax=Paraferrimonas sedimenticola TaxID=375674 RepID=A0AA37VSR2_9GAMM|nr:hypothetical protein [Paraferrimonas sedimenticola]GLP94886.1 hypothetical protein GCM10007895_01920 [Paraferrimonas sedimenticola]
MSRTDDGFFSVSHNYPVFLQPHQGEASQQGLVDAMPESFRMLSEIAASEQQSLGLIKQLPQGDVISQYLQLQAKKVDILLQFVMAQQPQQGSECQGLQFGGSHLLINSPTQLQTDQVYQARLYIKAAQLAVFCLVEPRIVEPGAIESASEQYQLDILAIGEAEQEMLVRASLLEQQKLLKLRQQARSQ